ncbi:atlastin-1-like [Saccostrea echinata]|uniref:atlastin-1-like n=1 Tax=Saccostrea echinata TaxID=191078 RepID=UPI002A80EA86|nr:atlastin-1-like [Saccostrea echinata]
MAHPGESLQIIRVTREENDSVISHGLELNEKNLARILMHPDVKENPVVIVSVAGAFRKGKSFLMGFFLKYLEAESEDCEWLHGDDVIEGFEWRGGSERVTSGIHIWSKPFIRENSFGEKIAILLMDTQGVFDSESTVKDCASVFALSNLISSVQIYNLMQQLQENDLQHLEFFSEFGRLAVETSGETLANRSRLIFLIRDWGIPYEYSYGKDGGTAYIVKKLKVHQSQHEEHQRLRRNLDAYFPDIGGFLLPHPGKVVVTSKTFNGKVKDIDEEFIDYVKKLVPYILSKEKLVTKRINSADVKGEDLLNYIEAYVYSLKNEKLPSPQTAFEATAAVGRRLAVAKALKLYKTEMEKVCNLQVGEFLPESELESHHERFKVIAREALKDTPRMQVMEQEFECIAQLDSQIEDAYTYFRSLIAQQNKNAILKQMADAANAAKRKAQAALAATGTAVFTAGAALVAILLKK